jgi:transposase
MAHPTAKRSEVRASFVQGLALETAAEAASISYQTARNWKRDAKKGGDCWDTARSARRMTGMGKEEFATQVVEEMATEFLATIAQVRENKTLDVAVKGEMLARLADSYSKIMSAAGRASPKLNALSISMEVLGEIGKFVGSKHPAQRSWFVGVLEEIGPVLAAKFR